MRAPASVYFVYFVKSISPECLVVLLNSNVVMSSADPRDERSLPEQKISGVEGEERTTLEILKSIPCSDDDGVALKLANPRILYI